MHSVKACSKFVLAGLAALATLAALGTAYAGGLTVLYTFKGGKNGSKPGLYSSDTGLISDSEGNLYGTTYIGGFGFDGSGCYCGTVFKLAPDGTETVLHGFANRNGDGSYPEAGLIRDNAGNLYGTTNQGPVINEYNNGYGIVFKIAPDGTETVLHTFIGGRDGGNPMSGLIQDSAGNLYGTTYSGGYSKHSHFPYSHGTVFKLATDGTKTVLHSFKGGSDGANPEAGLIQDATGNFYGTTSMGGASNPPCIDEGDEDGSCGTVFKITPDGKETVLYAFKGVYYGDGATPAAGLILDKSGNLYGTTEHGGLYGCTNGEGDDGCGTVFRLAPDGTETMLYKFTGENGDGGQPAARLVRDKAGNLYGTTSYVGGTGCIGGAGCGTIFRIAPDGTETLLYAFGHHPHDGTHPWAGLMKGTDGELYGTASGGGSEKEGIFRCAPNDGCGTVFRIKD